MYAGTRPDGLAPAVRTRQDATFVQLQHSTRRPCPRLSNRHKNGPERSSLAGRFTQWNFCGPGPEPNLDAYQKSQAGAWFKSLELLTYGASPTVAMASVRSLGLHRPSGWRHAIEEQLIAPDDLESSYTWDITTDSRGGDSFEDELLTTSDCVIWSRGRLFRRAFKFGLEKEPIIQALIAFFPASEHHGSRQSHNGSPSERSTALERALVVFLKTQAHVFFLSGTSHIVHMPFEVEAACAGPVGVIIQRKRKTDNIAPVALKFPRVPPNFFVSSQPPSFGASQQTAFSVEGLGKPKSLHLGLGSTLEHMWDSPLEQQESHWPRLIVLTDPLSDIGLVVGEGDANARRTTRRETSPRPIFLDPAEEILHIEEIRLPGVGEQVRLSPLVLAVTINRENGSYTVWRLKYLEHSDPFIGHLKRRNSRGTRRRSSMPAPGFVSAASTPVQPNLRESFGAPLPGKRQRKSEKIEKPIDLVSSLEQQDNEGSGATRRSSRRLSSMLARGDLSASHDRSAFADQPAIPGSGTTKRNESFGTFHGRLSSSSHQIHPSLGSLLEAPIDVGLDESLHNMGLDDRGFDGLEQEIRFIRVQTFSLDSSNVRYSTSALPAKNQSKVFILTAPSFAVDEQKRTQLLIGIQEPLEKRLQMMTLHVKYKESPEATPTPGTGHKEAKTGVTLIPGSQWKVQSVVDSSKLVDGDLSVIVVLSDSTDGRHELSIQAPWIELTKISLSLLFVDDTRGIEYRGRVADRDVKQRKSEVIDLTGGAIVGLRHPRKRGVLDAIDTQGRLHQMQIQLQPACAQTKKVLQMCRSILPDSLGGRVHAGWLHVMQWLGRRGENVADGEWRSLVILLLAAFLNLERDTAKSVETKKLPMRKRRPPSGSFGSIRESEDWRALEAGEAVNSLACPVWMLNSGWQWALDEESSEASQTPSDPLLSPRFLPQHIALAKEFLTSEQGEAVMGSSGYFPMALGKSHDTRRKVAVDLFMGLHLLLDEHKLNITMPEYSSPGRTDLRVLLCQLSRWLRWDSFSGVHDLGIQEDVDPRYDTGKSTALNVF